MSTLSQFSSLVSTLYEAAADEQLWEEFLSQFRQTIGCSRGVLTTIAPEAELTTIVSQGYTASEMQAYSAYFYQHDVVLGAGLEVVTTNNQWIGSLEEILPYRDLESSEIYNDHYRALDMHYAACMMLGSSGPYSALGLAGWRSKSAGPFQPQQLELVKLLTPHFKQAFLLSAKLKEARMRAEGFSLALETAKVAVIGFYADGSVANVSTPAENLIRRREVLMVRDRRLYAVNDQADRLLQNALSNAIFTANLVLGELDGKGVLPGGSFLLHVSGKSQPLQVQVMPIRSSKGTSHKEIAALLFITDPEAAQPSRSIILQQLYRLTPVEARLADLFVQGREVKEAAQELRLSYDNTRFHLKQIFRKTNTSRQVELLRLLLALPK